MNKNRLLRKQKLCRQQKNLRLYTKYHLSNRKLSCFPGKYIPLFRYLVQGYQQYQQTYPQFLCITFSYAECYPPASEKKVACLQGFYTIINMLCTICG